PGGTTSSINEGVIGSGTTEAEENDNLTDLTPNTTYYFQYQATNSSGTTKAPIQSFTTLAVPPDVTAESAAPILATTATLKATVNPEAAGTSVRFVYGTDPNLATGTSSTAPQNIGAGFGPVNVTASATVLSPSTTYYFQAVATNSAGTTKGTITQFTTAAA